MKSLLFFTAIVFGFISFASAQTTYYSEDFEAGQPSDWTVEGEWMHGTATTLGSPYFPLSGNESSLMAFNDDKLGATHTGNGRMETANIDLTGISGPMVLEMNLYFLNEDHQGADETFIVYASYDDGITWEELKSYDLTSWEYIFINVDQFAGETVKLAFEYVDGEAWNFGAAIDDIFISDLPINSLDRSYLLTVNGGEKFDNCGQNIDYPVEGVFINNGYIPVTAFDITVMNNGTLSTSSFDGFSLEKGEGIRYEVADKINTGEDDFEILVSISNVNGVMTEDDNPADNSAVIAFAPIQTHPDKAVVVERTTGTWCKWCPKGAVYLDEMTKRFGNNFVGIAVHGGANDPMLFPVYNSAISGFPDYPGATSVIYNRMSILDPDEIVITSMSDLAEAPEVTIEVGADEIGGSMSSNVRVNLINANTSTDYNVAVILTENGLSGVETADAQWNQINEYSGGGEGPMGGFEYLGETVSSDMWPYSFVGRALIGGFEGINGITGSYEAGASVIVEMEDFNLNTDWEMENMNIIAIVTDASGQIVNAVSESLNIAIANGLLSLGTATTDVYSENLVSVSPNLVSVLTNIKINIEGSADVSIQVTDMMGQLVSKRTLGTVVGKQNVGYDVSNLVVGNYVFKIIAGNKIATQKVMVLR